LPSDSTLGLQWRDGGLDFLGQGKKGKVPVYAVADGLLTRVGDWTDAVAILHTDPLDPTQKVWSYYSDMADANGTDSYVADEFPPGASAIPVKMGALLGYQGTWSGKPFWPAWTHLHFALLRPQAGDEFPKEIALKDMLDPAPYLSITMGPQTENEYIQSLKCRQS
jgi:hypothetical protein